MSAASVSLTYRRAAVQQATPEQLAVALLDVLVADLREALAAFRRGAIDARSNALKHGFQVLAQLQTQVRPGTPATAHLERFYAHLRRQMLLAQFRADAPTLEALIPQIPTVRAAFQQVDARRTLGTAPADFTAAAAGDPVPLSLQA